MQVDVLIIGQGICGTLLSWFLQKEGRSYLVIDDATENAASKVAAGVINPVTGRRYVTAWMAEEVMAFANITYKQLGEHLATNLIHPKNIIDFFPTAQMRNTFVDRISENDTYLHPYPDQNLFNPLFNYDFGCGEIRPAYAVDLPGLLAAWRKKLVEQKHLREETFMLQDLKVEREAVQYRAVTAEKIIFCDGVAGIENPYFSLLPYSANKGEALLLKCADLDSEHIYKRGMLMVPLPTENMFWFGSNYQWEFEDAAPTEAFYKTATEILRRFLKVSYEIADHKASIRPATLERRPFVGFHPQFPRIGILNGMGTKGASLAPFFANQLAQHITHNLPIIPEADVQRFNRILSK
jgi:glycine/D-amino acid oxidase-like deaminating enzyme